MSRLEDIAKRAEKARPGPWVRMKHPGDLDMVRQEHWTGCENPRHDDCAIAQVASPEVAVVRLGHPEYDAEPNAEFIAHARSDVPWLLERVSELEAENERDVGYLLQRLSEVNAENERLKTECEGLHALIQRATEK